MVAKSVTWRAVLPRVVAATMGAYALCYAWICALVVLLPMDGVDANILVTCLGFLLFVGVILRAFAISSVARLWAEIAVGTVLPAAIVMGIVR